MSVKSLPILSGKRVAGLLSPISWTHFTFNPWWGCNRVNPECDNCYADRQATYYGYGGRWDVPGARAPETYRRFDPDGEHWQTPLRINAWAALHGVRLRGFCASMADLCDPHAPPNDRARFWELAELTPFIDWLCLTKRPGLIPSCVPSNWSPDRFFNVWWGTSTGSDRTARAMVPRLLSFRRFAARLFLSAEPMLGWLDVRPYLPAPGDPPTIDGVICGGESGPAVPDPKTHQPRRPIQPFHPAWEATVRTHCGQRGVPYHMKQWGDYVPCPRSPAGGVEIPESATHVTYVWEDGRFEDRPARTPHPTTEATGIAVMRHVGKKEAGRTVWDGAVPRTFDALPRPHPKAPGRDIGKEGLARLLASLAAAEADARRPAGATRADPENSGKSP